MDWQAPTPPSRLQKERVGDDGADRGKCNRARDHVLWTMQQNAHEQAALCVRFDRNRVTAAAAAARHVIIPYNLSRHFSSPDELGLVVWIAMSARAW